MAYITAQNAFPAKIHFAQLWLADECIISYSAEFVTGGSHARSRRIETENMRIASNDVKNRIPHDLLYFRPA